MSGGIKQQSGDPTLDWLQQQMADNAGPDSLWCCDENALPLPDNTEHWHHRPTILSNRWDLVQQAQTRGFEAHFSDFDFSRFDQRPRQQVFYRISKEKPLLHYLCNQAFAHLAPGGELFLCGEKGDGAKAAIARAATLFGDGGGHRKLGNTYCAVLRKCRADAEPPWLNDSDYHRLRPVATRDGLEFYSKPGVFGWHKIDPGSAFLVDALPGVLDGLATPPRRLLDLGCGYGFLALMTHRLPLQRRLLTDNNAAALIAARHNCSVNGVAAEVVAADCGDGIAESFDLILCNPPFHQGFAVEGNLTDRFLGACRRLLTADGLALFVINSFIPLERKAQPRFSTVNTIANNGQFKLVVLRL